MNLLFVYPTAFIPYKGGVERVTYLLSLELRKRGHNIFHLHTHKDINETKFEFPTVYFPSSDYNNPINIPFYHQFIKKHNIDIVINQCGAHSDSILFNNTGSSSTKSISVIHFNPAMNSDSYWHEISQLRNKSLKEKIKRLARCICFYKIKRDYRKRLESHYNWLFNNSDTICLLSKLFKDELLKLSPENYVDDKVVSIYNPIELKSSNHNTKENIILWVGRFDTGQKRPDRCIEIWKKLSKHHPDWQLIMIGDGQALNHIKKKARGLTNISFTGYTDPTPYYEKAKLLIMTSNFEGWGMVLAEAMAYNVIPLAFNSFKSVKELITNNAQIVTPFNLNEYIEKLEFLMTHQDYCNRLNQESYDHINKFFHKQYS